MDITVLQRPAAIFYDLRTSELLHDGLVIHFASRLPMSSY
jgi:hypothetical protein